MFDLLHGVDLWDDDAGASIEGEAYVFVAVPWDPGFVSFGFEGGGMSRGRRLPDKCHRLAFTEELDIVNHPRKCQQLRHIYCGLVYLCHSLDICGSMFPVNPDDIIS